MCGTETGDGNGIMLNLTEPWHPIAACINTKQRGGL